MEAEAAPHVRPREEDNDELQEAPSLKRKKTVTWADGEELTDMHHDGEDRQLHRQGDQAEEPAALKVEGVDALFTDLREAALRDQMEVPKSDGEPLTKEQLKSRRSDRFTELEAAYKSEFWSLADELLLRAWGFGKDTNTPTQINEYEGRATRSRSKYAEAATDSNVVKALQEGGVQAAWSASASILDIGDIERLPSEDEISDFVLSLKKPADAARVEALRKRMVQRREEFLSRLSSLGRLEASAAAATSWELERRGAVAALCGSNARYFLRRTAITVGRGDEAGVDVDLSGEGGGAAVKAVSRMQAQLFLDADGKFKVRCLGRRTMSVNGETLSKGQVAVLPHLSVIRIGPLALLFVLNKEAIDRVSKRSAALTVC